MTISAAKIRSLLLTKKFISIVVLLLAISPSLFMFQNCGKGFDAIKATSSSSLSLNCTPGANLGCATGNGPGNQVCDAQGLGYGACALSSCDAGFNLQNGIAYLTPAPPAPRPIALLIMVWALKSAILLALALAHA